MTLLYRPPWREVRKGVSRMIVRCKHCGQANRIPAQTAGKRVVCGACRKPLQSDEGLHPVQVDDGSFARLVTGEKPVVVDFWAPWCGPCRQIAPVIESLASSRSDVVFAKLNVDENPVTSAKYRVSGIPTLLFFRNGEEKGRIVGAVGRPQIEQAIKQHLHR